MRIWQLGLEMRPFFNRESLWAYPVFGAVGGSFGYWMMRIEHKQMRIIEERRERLLEKRQRRAAREAAMLGNGPQPQEQQQQQQQQPQQQ